MTPKQAYETALSEGPSHVTRSVAIADPDFAALYARNVDRCWTPETYDAAAGSRWRRHVDEDRELAGAMA